MRKIILFVIIGLFSFSTIGWTKDGSEEHKSRPKKTQEVRFDEESVDGVVRKPDGLYLVQKKSVDFIPLYQIRKSFDENIKGSVEYLR